MPREAFDAILCAGNVLGFLHPDTRRPVLAGFAARLAEGGRAVVGFGAGRGYAFDDFFTDVEASGLVREQTFSTWDLRPFRSRCRLRRGGAGSSLSRRTSASEICGPVGLGMACRSHRRELDRISVFFLSKTSNELGTELESLKMIFEMKKNSFINLLSKEL